MKWIKSHLTIVVCGAVGVISLALIVMGIVMSTAQEAMARDGAVLQNLTNAGARPVNQRIIDQDAKLLDANKRQLDAIEAKLKERGGYKPLPPEVFPDISPTNGSARFLFKPELLKAQRKMVADLNAKPAPTPQEEAIEAEEMRNQQARAARAASLGTGATPPARTTGFGVAPGIAPGVAPGVAPGFASGSFTARADMEGRKNMTPEQLAEKYAEVRLAIRRAREIYCYVGTDEDTFGKWPDVTAVSTPTVDQMWYAQMGLWIQQDVVKALAGLNTRVAEGLKARQQQAWVGNLPVKHVRRITINGYLPWGVPGAAGASPSVAVAGKPGDSLPSFSPGCSNDRDVIQFNLDLVVEARMLPSVIDELCKAGFLTPIMVKYEIQPANLSWSGCIYGSVPTLHVSIDFEGSFLRAKYEKWVPESVKKAIETGQAKFQQGVSSTGGAGSGMPSPSVSPGFRPGGHGPGE